MKKILLFAYLLIGTKSFGQLGIRITHMRPTGDLGAIMKPTVSGELLYFDQGFDDEDYRMRIGLSFFSLKPRMDTFPVYMPKYDGTGIIGGTQVFHSYKIYLLSGGYDYAVINKEPLSLYPGIDVLMGGIDRSYDLDYPAQSSDHFSGGDYLVGVRLRIGGEYKLTDMLGAFAEISRSLYYLDQDGTYAYNEYAIGLHLTFE